MRDEKTGPTVWEILGVKPPKRKHESDSEPTVRGITETIQERLDHRLAEVKSELGRLPQAFEFYEQHKSSLDVNEFLGGSLVAHGKPACGRFLLDVFGVHDMSLDPTQMLQPIVKMDQEQIEERWKDFLARVEAFKTEIPEDFPHRVFSWIFGRKENPFPSPEEGDDWLYFHKAPNVREIALYLLVEYERKRNQQQREARWPPQNQKEILISEKVSAEDVKRIFGDRGPERVYDLIPEELRGLIPKIKIVDHLDVADIESQEGDIVGVKLDGRFDQNEGILYLVITPEQTIDRMLETAFHEFGHAMIATSSDEEQRIRMQFANAVAHSGRMLMDPYASHAYDNYGIAGGLEEDFAETVRMFFLDPGRLHKQNLDRYNVIEDVLAEHVPSWDREETTEVISGFRGHQ